MVSMNPLNNYRGQVAVFYALLVPVFLFLGGVGLDLGWYYLNVSRLQNAADAAVLAGADKLIETNTKTFKDYKAKLVDKFPADNPARDSDSNLIDTTACDQATLEYAKKNLEGDSTAYAPPKLFSVAQAAEFKDGYTRGNPTVTMTPSLYKDGEDYYYVLHLTEDIHHFFIGFLDDMEAPVVAVALMSKNIDDSGGDGNSSDDDPKLTLNLNTNDGTFEDGTTTDSKKLTSPSQMEDGETSEPISSDKGTPTYKDGTKAFKGWSTNPNPSAGDIIDIYLDGTQLTKSQVAALFGDATEVTLYAVWEDVLPTNNKTLWEQMQYIVAKDVYDGFWKYATRNWTQSPYNLSFAKSQLPVKRAKIGYTYYTYYEDSVTLASDTSSNGKTIGQMDKLYLDYQHDDFTKLSDSSSVAHSHINVNAAYSVRSAHVGKDDDPLYIRIENEPVRNGTTTAVRQVVIDINANNTADNKRPLFFFYDKPENNRDPKPVILNLNNNFKGVLFMPEAPVVINGNGYKFEGFIVAKEYHYLSRSGANISGTKYYIDKKGNIQTIKATGNNAKEMFETNGTPNDRFYLSDASKFKMFNMEHQVNYAYVWYDMNGNIIEEPFHERYTLTNDLIPIYGNSGRITKWENVTLFKDPVTDSNGNKVINRRKVDNPTTEISDKEAGLLKYGAITLLDDDGYPIPIYDEAGNPIYFVNDYGRLGKDYTVLTLDKVTNEIRTPHEFLIETKESNTDDWI